MAKHSVLIDDELYTQLGNYCEENGLKIGQFVNSLLKKGLMYEMYGDTPFCSSPLRDIEEEKPVVEERTDDLPPDFLKYKVNEGAYDFRNSTGKDLLKVWKAIDGDKSEDLPENEAEVQPQETVPHGEESPTETPVQPQPTPKKKRRLSK